MGLQNTLRALADPTRRSILELLKSGRLSAGEISERFAMTAAAVSRHLSVLKEADLIRDTRQGKFIIYELNASVVEEILLWLTALKGEENHAEESENAGAHLGGDPAAHAGGACAVEPAAGVYSRSLERCR